MITTKNVDRSKLTGMMLQYAQVKDEYPNDVVLFRVGDFFEAYFEDAVTFSTICGIVFTGKRIGSRTENKKVNLYSGEDEKLSTDDIMNSISIIPMAGVPHKALNQYAQQLIYSGKRVVVVEQLEDPKTVQQGQLVKRGVVCILSNMDKDGEYLSEYLNNWICLVYNDNSKYSLCFADVSTCEVYITTVEDLDGLLNEVSRYKPSEIILNSQISDLVSYQIEHLLKLKVMVTVDDDLYDTTLNKSLFEDICKSCKISNIQLLGYKSISEIYALYLLLAYVKETKKIDFELAKLPIFYTFDNYMSIDMYSRVNLELTENISDKSRRGSLIGVLDTCKTSMGSRLLKQWIDRPLLNKSKINKRLDAVTELISDETLLSEIRNAMIGILDISRIMGRLKLNKSIPRDLVNLKVSLQKLPNIKNKLNSYNSGLISDIFKNMDTFDGLVFLLDKSLLDDPVSDIKEGLVLKSGYNSNLDTARDMIENSNKYLSDLEESERVRTGIKNLKVVNKNGKCAIEVTKQNLDKIPSDYRIEKALKSSTRYVTDESERLEKELYSAIERSKAIEIELYEELKATVLSEYHNIILLCDMLSTLDVLCSFANVALENNYNRPTINSTGHILIQEGRHPVVEKMQGNFIVNDTTMDLSKNNFLIITGPNMAGKSTYMRQVALIVLMAHIGSYVPALLADISLTDKIFTRIGASDDISSGRSTYMVEMSEVKNILDNATKNSLVILDEVGRGTSTSDGMAIAQAISEYIINNIGCKTLFATHYHELTVLENNFENIKNYHMAVSKENGTLEFIRKLEKGGLSESYGIDVAELAGIPSEVIKRAWQILGNIEKGKSDILVVSDSKGLTEKEQKIIDIIGKIDRYSLSPSNAYFQMCHILDLIN